MKMHLAVIGVSIMLLGVAGGNGCCPLPPFDDPAPDAESPTEPPPPPVKLVAHRGESGWAPENTMSAFRLAWRNGAAYAVETDLRRTSDGQIVCVHDNDLRRLSSGAADAKPIEAMDSAELRQYDVGSWKDPQFAAERVPTLAELLAAAPPQARFFLEIKSGVTELATQLPELLTQFKIPADHITLISFDAQVLRTVRETNPNLKALLLVDWNTHPEWTAAEWIALGKAESCAGLSFGDNPAIDADFIRAIHEAGLECHVWTVDLAERARDLQNAGIDSITTNYPTAILPELQNH